jgi:hypothetical protein
LRKGEEEEEEEEKLLGGGGGGEASWRRIIGLQAFILLCVMM